MGTEVMAIEVIIPAAAVVGIDLLWLSNRQPESVPVTS